MRNPSDAVAFRQNTEVARLEATCEESKLGVHRLLRGEWSPVWKLPVRNPSNYIGIAENIGPVSGSYL